MRQAATEIHRAINWIHHPTPFSARIPDRAFLAKNSNLRKCLPQIALNLPLTSFIQFQLDVMCRLLVDALMRSQLAFEKMSHFAGDFLSRRQGGIDIRGVHSFGNFSRRIHPFDR